MTVKPNRKLSELLLQSMQQAVEIDAGRLEPARRGRIASSAADAELLRARRAELASDGDQGEPWRQTIQEIKKRGA